MDYIIKDREGDIVFHGVAQEICEALQCYLEDIFGYFPMLQENEDEGFLEVYLHTDTYELLDDDEIEQVLNAGITENDSLPVICDLLKISVEPAN